MSRHEPPMSPSVAAPPLALANSITLSENVQESSAQCRMEDLVLSFLIPRKQPPSTQMKHFGVTYSQEKPTLHKCFLFATVLNELHRNMSDGISTTQRDLYYHVFRKVTDQQTVNGVIVELAGLLRLPRSMLGVQAGYRGSIGGSCTVHGGIDLRTLGAQGCPIPGQLVNPNDPLDGGAVDCPSARFLLVVEKDAVFQRLMAERIFDIVPCVLVTGHGFPTLAVRALIKHICNMRRDLLVVGLVDYNPSGVHILLQYRCGRGKLQEARGFAIPDLHWLGVRSSDIPKDAVVKPFTRRCRSQTENLIQSFGASDSQEDLPEAWKQEVIAMQTRAVTCEIEALYPCAWAEVRQGHSQTFAQLIASKILRQQFI